MNKLLHSEPKLRPLSEVKMKIKKGVSQHEMVETFPPKSIKLSKSKVESQSEELKYQIPRILSIFIFFLLVFSIDYFKVFQNLSYGFDITPPNSENCPFSYIMTTFLNKYIPKLYQKYISLVLIVFSGLFYYLSISFDSGKIIGLFLSAIVTSEIYVYHHHSYLTSYIIETTFVMFFFYLISYLCHNSSKSKKWLLVLILSTIISSFLFLQKVEYCVLFVPIIMSFIYEIVNDTSLIFIYSFVLLLSIIFLKVMDIFVGLPQISLDTVSLPFLKDILFEEDFDGIFMLSLVMVPSFVLFSKFLSTQMLLIIEILFALILSAQNPLSSKIDTIQTRIGIIRSLASFALGICLSSLHSVILILIFIGVIASVVTLYFYNNFNTSLLICLINENFLIYFRKAPSIPDIN